MDTTATMPVTTPAATAPVEIKKEHWVVEFVGGMTLATTMISALSLWYVFLAYASPLGA